MPKVVVSTTLEEASWHNSTILREDVVEGIRALKADQTVLVWASPTLVRTLMEEALVDEYALLVAPIVRGHGKELLPEGAQHDLEIAEARTLDGGMLALRLTPRGQELPSADRR